MRPIVAAIAAAATGLLLGACTQVTTGAPITATQQPGPVDVHQLNVGNYPVVPSQPLGDAVTSAMGAIIEGQRLANYTTGPWEVDPTLIDSDSTGGMVLKNAGALKLALPEAMTNFASQDKFVAGFYTGRNNPAQLRLENIVLQFSDPAAAGAAARELAAGAAETADGTTPQPVTIVGHPDTTAVSRAQSDQKLTVVRAVTAHGPHVLIQFAQGAGGGDPLTAIIAKTLDLQVPLIDTFTPTDPAKLAELPKDPTGLLARTLPLKPSEASVNQRTVYDPRGALQFQSNPVLSAGLFTDAGLTHEAISATAVYETRDAQSAKHLVDGFFKEVSAKGKPAPAVNMLPDSRCLNLSKGQGDSYYCLLTADRYVITAPSAQLVDAQQKAAAQYAMLMAK